MEPVLIAVMAGSWLIASVCTPFRKHSLSAIRAVHGSSSLTQAPESPCWRKSKGGSRTGNVAWPAVIPVTR